MDHQPVVIDLLVNVGHTHRQIHLFTVLVGTGDVLDAVAVSEIVVGGSVEVRQLDGDRAVEAVEKLLPVLTSPLTKSGLVDSV